MLLLFSAATFNILSHCFRFVNNFLNFFLNLFRFALLFSAACYILPDVFAFVNSFFNFLFCNPLFSRVSYTISFNHWFVNGFFQFLCHFLSKDGAANARMHPQPHLSIIFSHKKPFNMRRNSQLNRLF